MLEFEWDEEKNRITVEKHGLSFERAMTIFDGFCILDEDRRFDYGENRWVATGTIEDGVVIVLVYTIRKPRIRIISARSASKMERRRYYEKIRERTDG